MSIIEFLKNLFGIKPVLYKNTGVLPDLRTDEEKQKDYLHEERSASPAQVIYQATIPVNPYADEDQHQTSSCVPHGTFFSLGVELLKQTGAPFVKLSKMFVYRQRQNYPQEGTNLPWAMNFGVTIGSCLYTTLPTPYYESAANAVVITAQMFNEANIFEGFEYYNITNFNDIDTLATVATQGHAVPILIYASNAEYSNAYPYLTNGVTLANAYVRHCVSIIPNGGFKLNGTKYVAVKDSAGFGGLFFRFLSEDFIKARVYGAAYFDKVKMVIGGVPLPKYTFTKTLKVGANNPEVKMVQQLLVHEGLLPVDCVTGLFGGRTLAGINAFQNKYASDILIPLGLNAPTGTWGSACIAKANKICYNTL